MNFRQVDIFYKIVRFTGPTLLKDPTTTTSMDKHKFIINNRIRIYIWLGSNVNSSFIVNVRTIKIAPRGI